MHPTSTTQAAPTRFGPAGSARPPGWGLVLAVAWRDGPALALAGLLAANAIHTINHAVDLDLGGHNWDPWGLAALTLLTAIALIVRLRQLGWVIGEVGTAATPALAPFVRQETVLLTSHRRDGRPVGTPVSMPGGGAWLGLMARFPARRGARAKDDGALDAYRNRTSIDDLPALPMTKT